MGAIAQSHITKLKIKHYCQEAKRRRRRKAVASNWTIGHGTTPLPFNLEDSRNDFELPTIDTSAQQGSFLSLFL
jgi:hypothetical protein